MITTRKYEVAMNMGSYGVWDSKGHKVASFGRRDICRYEALCYLYLLNGWDWQRSKYVRANPSLATLPETIKNEYGYEITNDNQ